MTNELRTDRSHTGSRLAFYASGLLIAQVAAIAIFAVRHYLLAQKDAPALGLDFPVYWAAARVAMEHGAAAIYSPQFMAPLETAVRPYMGYTPWAYPPTFLFVVLPFGPLPFGTALAAFLALTTALYVYSMHSIVRASGALPWRYALAFPAVFVVVVFGQNSLLTAAIAGIALVLLPRRPLLSGAFIALLGIKPQLAILFPLLLLCARQWRALASATAFSLLLALSAVLAFGPSVVAAFMQAITAFRHDWLERNTLEIWFALASVYGAARVHGASSALAYAIHAAVTLPAIASVAWLWYRNARYELRAAAFAAGAMLAPPYFVFYDLAWLALPIAFLAVDMQRHGASRAEIAILIVAWFAPAQALVARWFPFIGQWSPAVLLALIGLIAHRHLLASRIATSEREREAFAPVDELMLQPQTRAIKR